MINSSVEKFTDQALEIKTLLLPSEVKMIEVDVDDDEYWPRTIKFEAKKKSDSKILILDMSTRKHQMNKYDLQAGEVITGTYGAFLARENCFPILTTLGLIIKKFA